MEKKKTYWLQAYKEVVESRNQGPDFKLIEYLDILPKGPVLDLGMGRGRHALFLAKLRRAVEGVDKAKFSKGLPEIVEAEGLDFIYHRTDLRDFEFPTRKYALIVAAKILQLFQMPEIEMIAGRMQDALKPRGVIYVYTFSVEDLQFIRSRDELEEVEKNTFYHAEYNLHFHFFSKEEIMSLFPKLKTHYYTEGLIYNRSSRRPRLNGVIQYVGQRMR